MVRLYIETPKNSVCLNFLDGFWAIIIIITIIIIIIITIIIIIIATNTLSIILIVILIQLIWSHYCFHLQFVSFIYPFPMSLNLFLWQHLYIWWHLYIYIYKSRVGNLLLKFHLNRSSGSLIPTNIYGGLCDIYIYIYIYILTTSNPNRKWGIYRETKSVDTIAFQVVSGGRQRQISDTIAFRFCWTIIRTVRGFISNVKNRNIIVSTDLISL